MKPETKKYLHKRRQIIEIITKEEITYQQYDEDSMPVDCTTNVRFWEARTMAEKILTCVGINKPKEVSEQESSGYAIG